MHAFQPTFQGNMAKDGNFLLEMMKHRHPMSSNFPTILLFTFILFAASLAAADAKDTLLSGQCISGNETLISKSGVFELGFFAYDGWYKYNLGIRYKNLVERTPVFLVQYPTHFSIGAPLCFLKDKLYTIGDHYPSENVLWSSEGNGSAASVAILLDTGNFVVRDEMNPSVVMWQSFDYQGTGDALQPGAWIASDTVTGASIMTNTNDFFPYYCTLQIDKRRKRGFAINVGGSYDFGGASYGYHGTFPDWMVTYKEGVDSVQLNVPKSPNAIEFLKLELGQVSFLRWSGNGTFGTWQPLWSFPSSCSLSPFICGAFGACTQAGKCRCIDGCKPTLADEWDLGRFTSGCSSIHPMKCDAENSFTTDTFVLLDNLQGLPVSEYARDEPATSSEECKSACLSSCYCTAYSYNSGCKIWQFKLHNLSLADSPPYSSI
ncbi:hypothetical protein PAHAL_5G527100 [Panicum hallii]|uniref:non-specific serine/threonine protein kinase n=1 Tax=Panicum hallii TaxID=206008 RepID=A0A2T8IPC6_9POAL|nr:S-locus-specific glycoprotein S6-like isoform X1 [Panicum hallii]PVH39520.1 hypothetical protein PAHAL_5G527100 [Panicum hallii]